MRNERKILQGVIDKRHKVIHGKLKDDEVELEEIEEAREALKRLVAFLKSKMDYLDLHFFDYSF